MTQPKKSNSFFNHRCRIFANYFGNKVIYENDFINLSCANSIDN